MESRIVLFGATGYTGEGAARALVRAGAKPVLAARSPERLAKLAEELGGLETALADVEHPASVRDLVERGDVLLSTVGPFSRFGTPAIEAAIDAGAHYLDSTGEASFIRRVFADYGPQAEAAGVALLTAFGYDFVPGNLAGALALREAGPAGARLEVGYFTDSGMSGGTRTTAIGGALDGAFVRRRGALKAVPAGAKVHSFSLPGGRKKTGVSVGGTEPLALAIDHPNLRDAAVYVGRDQSQSAAFPLIARTLPVVTRASSAVTSIPGVRPRLQKLAQKRVKGSTGGPGEASRARKGSTVVAEVLDASGAQLSEVTLSGINPYTFTFEILAWGARELAGAAPQKFGALGPTQAFSLDALEAGVAAAGLAR